ncbi:hypothetical protein ABVB69_37060 [Streptomyces sp. NPDC000349]|uniref:hypothetical protein n=1 Tax=Streptomyces sp. NPDC000349 TaxID=3154249 RepID=UPI00336AE37D
MHLADSCDDSIDIGKLIFGNPIAEMMRVVAKIAMRGAFSIFEAVGTIDSYDENSSGVINRQTQWIVVYLAVGSILFAAIKMALDRRADSGQAALKGILRITLVNTAASTVLITFTILMDRYSDHLFRGALDDLMGGMDCSDEIPSMLLLVLGCLLIVSGIVHALLMWIRLGVMIILMGTLPLAAAASMTEWGGTWWRKHIGWMIAWLLYKPTVSLVFFSGSVMMNAQATGSDGASKVNTQVAGMGVLLLSAIALPALMRVIVPATEALGADSAEKAAMSAAGGVASGAKSLGGGAASLAGGPAGLAAGAAGAFKPSGASTGNLLGGGGGGESSGGGDSSPSGGGGGESSGGGDSSPSGGGGGETTGGGDNSFLGGGGSLSGGSEPQMYSDAWYENLYNRSIEEGMPRDIPGGG